MALQAIRFTHKAGSPATLEILDQLLLPHRSAYISIQSTDEAWNAIQRMNVRGAPAIAIVAALGLAVDISTWDTSEVSPLDLQNKISRKLDYLVTSRPTAVNLTDAVRKLKAVVAKVAEAAKGHSLAADEVVRAYMLAAKQMLEKDVMDNEAIGSHGVTWMTKRSRSGSGRDDRKIKILTHCNTGSLATAGHGTALGIVRSLHAQGLIDQVFCTETRPYNQGSRLTAYELVHDKIPATLITDSMAASLMNKEGKSLAAVVVGADRVAANGDTANKIGTYALAVLARHHGVLFVVAAPRTTIDLETLSGKDIKIEQRPGEEVTRIRGPESGKDGKIESPEEATTISTAAMGISVWNPAFDVTPAALIDAIVTEVGVAEKGADGQFDLELPMNR